ncbi:hypothetical protein PIB30_021033 [Stylosanthes scabra]|uniref:Uncharacterized protein n=1 Tax=Stylosanthes scabra TaxID=79078 RepID=A0ABU6V6W7_9FABA|nr:hypothetical protein [Stylosanthes scabra]
MINMKQTHQSSSPSLSASLSIFVSPPHSVAAIFFSAAPTRPRRRLDHRTPRSFAIALFFRDLGAIFQLRSWLRSTLRAEFELPSCAEQCSGAVRCSMEP